MALWPSRNPPFSPTPARGRLSRKGNDPAASDRDPPKRAISPKLAVHWPQKTRIPGTIVHGIVPFLAGWIAIISGYYNIFFSDFYLYFLLSATISTDPKFNIFAIYIGGHMRNIGGRGTYQYRGEYLEGGIAGEEVFHERASSRNYLMGGSARRKPGNAA